MPRRAELRDAGAEQQHAGCVRRGDRVRLVREVDSVSEVDAVRAGSLGRILGYVRGPDVDAYVVAFDAGPSRILEAADLELADKAPSPEAPPG